MTRLWVDGQPVGQGILRPGTDAGVPAISAAAATGLQRILWTPRALLPQEHRLRWESERSRSALWRPVPQVVEVRPKVHALSGTALDTVGMHASERIWGDREDSLGTLAAEFPGALLVQGQASQRSDSSARSAFWISEARAQVCVVSDTSWQAPAGWTRDGNAARSYALWCRIAERGEVVLAGPRHGGGVGNRQGLSWLLRALPERKDQEVPVQAGDTLGGWAIDALPALLDSARLLRPVRLADGRWVVDLAGPGQVFIAAEGSLRDSLLGAGWKATGAKVGTRPVSSGIPQELDVLVPPSQPVHGSLIWGVGPAFVFVQHGRSSALVDAGPAVRIDTLRVGHGVPLHGDTIVFQGPPPGTIILTPQSCETRQLSPMVRAASVLWFALPDSFRLSATMGWTRIGRFPTSRGDWMLWMRRLDEGRNPIDLSSIFLPTDCAEFVAWGEDGVRMPLGWKLQEVRLRGFGADRSVEGGLHKIRDLDLEFLAAAALRSTQYQMRLTGSAGWGSSLRQAVLGLGQPRVADRVLPTGEVEQVVVSREWALSDLVATRLDADSVHVEARTLDADGKVKLTIEHRGGVPFRGDLKAILFRDRDGDFVFDDGTDEVLGAAAVMELAQGQSVVVDFPVAGKRLYPEELFIAWVDAGETAPERRPGDHLAVGPSPCGLRKGARWSTSPDGLAAPRVQSGFYPGVDAALAVHLRDTDGDRMVLDVDSADLLWYSAGRLWLASPGGDTVWTRPVPQIGSVSGLEVRDLDGDGRPEILAGDEVLDRNGALVWREGMESVSLDFDDDGWIDTVRVNSTCTEIRSGLDSLLWTSASCAVQKGARRVAGIERHPQGCLDVSVSAPRILAGGTGFTLRLANAGNDALPEGLSVGLEGPSGALRHRTSRGLQPGEWEDLVFETGLPIPAGSTWKAHVDRKLLLDLGLQDGYEYNDRLEWTEEAR